MHLLMETLALVEWEALMMQLLQGLMNWQKLLSLVLLQISKDKFIELKISSSFFLLYVQFDLLVKYCFVVTMITNFD